jgi:hypothetical protein
MAKRVFISFDYDHDASLKELLVGQARHPGTPFSIADWSVKEHIYGNWKAHARDKIGRVDVVAVICGEHTHMATGVAEEVRIAQQELKPYFLLWGYSDRHCMKPSTARPDDKMYKWTWDNVKALIDGAR